MIKNIFLFLFIFAAWSTGFGQKSTLKPQKIKDSLRVAAVQFPLAEGQSQEQLFKKMLSFIEEAKNNGAEMIVFPELITTELVNWYQGSYTAQLEDIAQNFTPTYIDWLKQQSIKFKVSILGGSTPRLVDRKIFNTAVLTAADGQVYLQDKIFLTPDEKNWNWSTGTELKVFDTPWGKTVIAICFDSEFPVISQMLAKAKPEVILVPSWTSSQSGLNRVDWTAKARAVEHFAYVIKTGTVPDVDSTQPHFGQASIITPQERGFPVTPIDGELNKVSIIYGDLDLKLLRERRTQTGYYPAKEQTLRKKPIKLID